MPKGSSRSEAKTASPAAAAAPGVVRSTRMRPAAVSATKTSPSGATRISRGASRPVANRVTVKPGGAFGRAPAGTGASDGPLLDERVA